MQEPRTFDLDRVDPHDAVRIGLRKVKAKK
jgi:hypothetical protein